MSKITFQCENERNSERTEISRLNSVKNKTQLNDVLQQQLNWVNLMQMVDNFLLIWTQLNIVNFQWKVKVCLKGMMKIELKMDISKHLKRIELHYTGFTKYVQLFRLVIQYSSKGNSGRAKFLLGFLSKFLTDLKTNFTKFELSTTFRSQDLRI